MFAQIESALPTCWAINRKHRLSVLRSCMSATTRSKSTRAFSYAPNCSRPRWLIVHIFYHSSLDTRHSLGPRHSSLDPRHSHPLPLSTGTVKQNVAPASELLSTQI